MYQELYNLTDQETKFFEEFFSSEVVRTKLDTIKKRMINVRIISVFLIVFIPVLICVIFYILYASMWLENPYFSWFIKTFFMFLFMWMLIWYIRLISKKTFTENLSSEINQSLLKLMGVNMEYIHKLSKEEESTYYMTVSDHVFYESNIFDNLIENFSKFLGTYNSLSMKWNLNLSEFRKEKYLSYDKWLERNYKDSFVMKNIWFDEASKEIFSNVTINGKELTKKKQLYYAWPKCENDLIHNYCFSIKFNESKINLDTWIKARKRVRRTIPNNYYLEIFLLGLYFISILYYVDVFMIKIFDINIAIYNYLILMILAWLIIYFFYSIFKRISNLNDITSYEGFFHYLVDDKEAHSKIADQRFFNILNEFANNSCDKSRNYEIYFRWNEILVKYDIFWKNWEVNDFKYMYSPFIHYYLDIKNIMKLVNDLWKYYYWKVKPEISNPQSNINSEDFNVNIVLN